MPMQGILASAGMKPSTPTIGTATDGGTGTTVSVAFTPSTYIGKGTITYTATSSPGSLTGTGSSSPITVSGLTTGTAYTFTVKGTTNYGVSSDSSAASNSVTPASPSSFESIATATFSGSGNSLTFNSIPQTYKSLQLRIMSQAGNAGGPSADWWKLRFNNDSAGNYAWHRVYADGTSTQAQAVTGNNGIYAASIAGTTNNTFSVSIVEILDYTSTSKYKTTRVITGGSNNTATGDIEINSGLWLNTAAITRIDMVDSIGYVMNSGTIVALYGIKG